MALGILQHTKICVSSQTRWLTIVLLSFVSFISGGLPPYKCGRRACSFPVGGVWLEKDVRRSRGVKVQAEECGQGEGGGLKFRKFCGRPLWMVPCGVVMVQMHFGYQQWMINIHLGPFSNLRNSHAADEPIFQTWNSFDLDCLFWNLLNTYWRRYHHT